jgi:cytoskeletal protein CcmA (bactofilin family)
VRKVNHVRRSAMFKNWGVDTEEIKTDGNGNNGGHKQEPAPGISENINTKSAEKNIIKSNNVNTILKGSKLIGDINVTCDMRLSGDVEGNITSEQNSNIIIQGTCRGNIVTKEGSVDIEGELSGGNITSGGNVRLVGKFNGGEATAKGKIYVNGEFNGKLEGNEIEIGPNASGKGELLYREYISIAKGAKIEAQISRVQQELQIVKNEPEKKIMDIKQACMKPHDKEQKEAK